MKCTNCKESKLKPWDGTVTRMGLKVEAHGYRCERCRELVFDDAEIERQDKEIAAKMVEHGIENAREFRFVRKIAGLKSSELAGLLDVKPETVSRWESEAVPLPRLAKFALGELFDRPQVTRRKLHA